MTPPTAQRIDTRSAIPYYLQLRALLRERIESGEWPSGTRIPVEMELCSEYQVSRITVRQAVALLVRDGLLTRQRGRGTFVREPSMTAAPRSVSSFSTELTDLGMKPGSTILRVAETTANPEESAELDCPPGTALLKIRRLRTADDRPIGIQDTLLIAERFDGLLDVLANEMSLYQVLRDYYGVVATGATEVFRAAGIRRDDAKLLECRAGHAGFQVQRITFDDNGIFERTSSILHGDRYQIRIALHNTQ